MIYLDYSATTPVAPEALDVFVEAARRHFANPNSLHAPGVAAAQAVAKATEGILTTLGAENFEVIYTSGATEANNLAIKGFAMKNRKYGMHLITTPFEHASVTACFGYLQNLGFSVDLVETGPDGKVALDSLEHLMGEDTILVSVAAVNSEIGIVQPLAEIAAIVARHSHAVLHSDVTQAIGKMQLSFADIDLVSFAAHKFYGLKGIGVLLRRPEALLEPVIHGGKSTTSYRSGTPAVPLILSMEKALELAVSGLDAKIKRVDFLNQRLRHELSSIGDVVVNSPVDCVPHILNLSVLGHDADDMLRHFDEHGICVSKQSACSSGATRSETVFRLTGDERRARTSIRVSISHLTTAAEIDLFVACLKAGLS